MSEPFDILTFEYDDYGVVEYEMQAVDCSKVREFVIERRKKGHVLRKKERGNY